MTYSIREAIAGFRRAPLLTGLSAGMVALALFVVGLFSLVAHNLRLALEEVESRVEVVVYLRDGADLNAVGEAEDDLRRLPEIRSTRYVSKDEALEQLRKAISLVEETKRYPEVVDLANAEIVRLEAAAPVEN